MEVRHDLDVEAAQSAESLGLAFARAATPGTSPRFASMITELVRERIALPDIDPGAPVAALGSIGLPDQDCMADCCRFGRPTAPADRGEAVRGPASA
jgi:ferrochelatase